MLPTTIAKCAHNVRNDLFECVEQPNMNIESMVVENQITLSLVVFCCSVLLFFFFIIVSVLNSSYSQFDNWY